MERIKPQAGGFTTDPQHGHETSDVNIRAILAFGAFLVFSAIVIHVLLWGMYRWLDVQAEKRNPEPNPMMVQKAAAEGAVPTMTAETEQKTMQRLKATFPEPRLQVDDTRDMNIMREEQNKQLEQYQWMNKETGKVRVPIDRAMELVLEHGLPVVPAGVTPAPVGQAMGTVQPVVKK
ncbi:MAG: hypothetical protein JWO13_1223 [Acidobacteriales bacterium]|nr:hypothetical protein [Terriglobales bacterium]